MSDELARLREERSDLAEQMGLEPDATASEMYVRAGYLVGRDARCDEMEDRAEAAEADRDEARIEVGRMQGLLLYSEGRTARHRAEAAEAALAAERAKVEHWQQKWKKRGGVIERLRDELTVERAQSAEHLALLDGETAAAPIKRDRAALTDPDATGDER